MYKAATINVRIEPKLKSKAEAILQKLGLTSAEAVRLFYKQICLRQAFPLELKLPIKETVKAAEDPGTMGVIKSFEALSEMMD